MNVWKNTNTIDQYVPELCGNVSARLAEIAVIGSKEIDVDSMPNLKGIFKCGVGKDNVPFEKCEQRGIEICFPSQETSNYIFEETANYAVSLIFRMLYSNVGDLDLWKKYERDFLGKRKVLLIGVGNIGGMVAKKLSPSVEVISYDALANTLDELPAKMKQADVVSLHVPLMDSTRSFIDAEKLSWMKDGAALVNTARGPIVDEDDLENELASGRLRAAFDVFWKEPYEGKLKKYYPDPFYMSPHIASNCSDFVKGLASDFEKFVKELSL